jgi:hypothetical protein
MRVKEFVIEYKKDRKAPKYSLKPRSPVAHAAQSVISGSGPHKDKKKAEKQGDFKHKKDKMPMESAGAGIFNIGDKVSYRGQPAEVIAVDGTAATVYVPNWKAIPGMVDDKTEVDPASKFLTPVGVEERVRDPEDWDEGNTEPPNNFAVYINGKKWKVFQGRGQYADDQREKAHYQQLKAWAANKSATTGKKWEVAITGEAPTA